MIQPVLVHALIGKQRKLRNHLDNLQTKGYEVYYWEGKQFFNKPFYIMADNESIDEIEHYLFNKSSTVERKLAYS